MSSPTAGRLGDLSALFSPMMAITAAGLDLVRAHFALYQTGRVADSAAARRPSASVPVGTSSAALIPVVGPLSQRPNFISDLFGWSDYETIGASLRAALTDPAVSTLAFFIDSPGGVISGLPELSDEIYASRRAKPSVAFASNLCASAAFWLGAQASQLVAQASADVGSVGVLSVHLDFSQQLAADGVRPTIIASTPYKAETSPLVSLTPEALQYEQGRIDALHGDFVAALARGRGVAAASVQRDFGSGRLLNAREARRVAMVDAISPNLGDALARMPGASRRGSSASSSAAARQREIDLLSLS
jgi:signal peptide peptidase SppA